ncbi:MAG TPA: hypothetical protein DCZ92_15235 [Elusimicrobia bacterium]|nr:MAG: hypothetical protein A2016_03180 [Elusimicrobia bacterium GWF2_62_30]HBA62134.1 hypothetical protein [Elusimicrobiota bacterium]
MPDYRIVLITANRNLAAAGTRAFISAGINSSVVSSCANFIMQDNKRDVAIVFLDLDCLGLAKMADLRAFVGKTKGISVIAMCDSARTSNREMVEILSSGVNDVINNSIDMTLLIAKTKAHLRRYGADQLKNEQAAQKWLDRNNS